VDAQRTEMTTRDGVRVIRTAAPFDPARRPRASTGAGLGLSIAKGIVQAHGGMLEPAALAKGTCFSVYLPVEGETLEARQTDRKPATGAGR